MLKLKFYSIYALVLCLQMYILIAKDPKVLKGEIFFVDKNRCWINLGRYHLVNSGDFLRLYREGELIGKIEVIKVFNFYSVGEVRELHGFFLKKGDQVKYYPDTDYMKLAMLSLNINRLQNLSENLQTLLQRNFKTYDLKDLASFIEWYYLRHGIIFDLTHGATLKKVLAKWKNGKIIQNPIFFLFQSPSKARNFIIYDMDTYTYWKKEIEKFEAYRKKIEEKNLRELEKKIFTSRRERDIKNNPYYETFVKYYGKPDRIVRKIEGLDFIKETCYWYKEGIWAEFINHKLLKQEKFRGER